MILQIFTTDSALLSFRNAYNLPTLSASKSSVPSFARCSTAAAPLKNAALLNMMTCNKVSQNNPFSNSVSTSSLITRSICLNSMLLRLPSIRASPSQSRTPISCSALSLLVTCSYFPCKVTL